MTYSLGSSSHPALILHPIYRAFLALSVSSAVYVSGVVSAQTSSGDAQVTTGTLSAARLQRERDDKTEEIRRERDEIKPVVDFRSQMETRKDAATKMAPKSAVIEAIVKGKKLLEEAAGATGKVNLRDNRILELQKVYIVLPEEASDAVDNPHLVPRSNDPIVSRVLDVVGRPEFKDEQMPHGAMEKFLTKLGVEVNTDRPRELPKATEELTWESIRKEIQEARTELETTESQLPKAVDAYKASLVEYYKNLLKGLDTELAARNARITTLREERGKIEVQLDKAGESQADINTLLVYAVYGMVLAIVGLFFLLRLFPAELARSIVVERTMIELLSMGFLLLTVIILGTGKLIGAETLGALLGTIAGYIFGQKQGERKGATEERAKMVDLIRGTGDGQTVTPPESGAGSGQRVVTPPPSGAGGQS